MPCSWTPEGGFEWKDVDYGTAPGGVPYEYAGAIPTREAADLAEAAQYQLATTGLLGAGYRQRPGAAEYIQRAQQPLLGQYLLTDPSVGMMNYAAGDVGKGFGDWLTARRAGTDAPTNLLGGLGWTPSTGEWTTTTAGQPAEIGWFNADGTRVPAEVAAENPSLYTQKVVTPAVAGISTTSSYNPWANIVQYARGLAGGAKKETLEDIQGSERWGNIMADPASVQALANLAMYDPTAGSLRGRLAGGGRTREMQRWQDVNPGATSAQWLSKIAEIAPGAYRRALPA